LEEADASQHRRDTDKDTGTLVFEAVDVQARSLGLLQAEEDLIIRSLLTIAVDRTPGA